MIEQIWFEVKVYAKLTSNFKINSGAVQKYIQNQNLQLMEEIELWKTGNGINFFS